MPQQISSSQTRLALDDEAPIIIDVETALDEVYTALSNERRRTVLWVLMRGSVPMDLEALVEKVAEQEELDGGESSPSELRDRLRLTLYHNHLPKLEALDLIKFDTEELVVTQVADSVSSL